MLKRSHKIALIVKLAFISIILLISCKILALPNDQPSFDNVLVAVEASKNNNPSEALKLLNSYQLDLTLLKVEQRIQYYKLLAEIYAEQDLYLKCKIFSEKGLSLSKELSSPSIVIAQLLYVKGYAHESLGEVTEAELNYEDGLELAKSLNDKKIIAEGLINLGAIYYLSERFSASLSALNEAYTLANQTDDEELKGSVNSELSVLYWYLGQGKKSVAYSRQAYQHFVNAGKTFYALNTLTGIAGFLSGRKKYDEAVKIYHEVLESIDSIDSKSLLYTVYSGLAWAELKQDNSNPEAALEYILLAGEYIENSEIHEVELYYLFNKAEILKELERFDQALETFYQADLLLIRPIQPQHKWDFIYTLTLKAELFHALSRYQESYALISEVIERVRVIRQEENLLAVDDLRLRYESEQADIQKALLEQNKELHSLELAESDRESGQQRNYLIASSLLALILAWLVIKLIYGQKSLLKASQTDSLTGMLNRRYTMQLASRLFNKTIEERSSLCVFMIDVDHFKNINDRFGHNIGDQVLMHISNISNSTMRQSDIFGRFGGEEFVAFLPNTSLKQGLVIAERLRLVIYSNQWPFKEVDKISISIGVCAYDGKQPTCGESLDAVEVSLESLLKNADQLLYQAKHQGRNKVCG